MYRQKNDLDLRKMARILLYKHGLIDGRGADRATAAFANAMACRGYEVHIITRQKEREPFSVTLDERITCHSLPQKKRPITKLINRYFLQTALGEKILTALFPKLDLVRRYSIKLQCLINQIQPDVLLVAGSNECVEALFAGPLEIPVVMMFHVYPLECFCKNKYRRASRFKQVLSQVAECQVLLPSHRELLKPYTKAPVAVIGNGISWPAEEPIPAAATREKQIVYIATFAKGKNHLDLLTAFAQLNAPDWTLQLYGAVKPEWEAHLKTVATTLGIADRVHFMGVTHLTRPILLRAGICAFPSKVEGFGLALAEAMWCGLPCVGFKTAPGVNEILSHEANGLLAEPTPEAFAAQLQRLIDDAQLREHLGRIAAKMARQTFPLSLIEQQWDDLIQRHCVKNETQQAALKSENFSE